MFWNLLTFICALPSPQAAECAGACCSLATCMSWSWQSTHCTQNGGYASPTSAADAVSGVVYRQNHQPSSYAGEEGAAATVSICPPHLRHPSRQSARMLSIPHALAHALTRTRPCTLSREPRPPDPNLFRTSPARGRDQGLQLRAVMGGERYRHVERLRRVGCGTGHGDCCNRGLQLCAGIFKLRGLGCTA